MPQLVQLGKLMGAGRRGSIAPWTPTSLGASLLGWWSADRVDLMTLSGALVTTWRDIVAGYAPTQAVAGSKPIYSATSFNGSPGVALDGIDDELTLGSVPFPRAAGIGSELWGLVQQDALPADITFRIPFNYGDGTVKRALLRNVVTGVNVAVAGAAATSTAPGDFSGRCVTRGVFTTGFQTAYLAGVAGTPAAGSVAAGSTATRIGAFVQPAVLFWQGLIRDIVVTDPLAAPQASLLQAYLDSKRNP